MHSEKELKKLRDAILASENSLKTAKHILSQILGEEMHNSVIDFSPQWSKFIEWETLIIEGVFTGESMLWSDGNTYPVPQNYASKSMLVQGSKLKAIIFQNGKISYKIIEEIEFENTIGVITKNGDKFQVTTKNKTYNVLVAAITFHKCSIGDTVRIRIPKWKEATYAVIENIIPTP